MVFWTTIWLIFWVSVMGLPIYLFKRYHITLHQNSWQHTSFYIFATITLFWVYHKFFFGYFVSPYIYNSLFILALFIIWLLAPFTYQQDYYTRSERLRYQVPKFFDIIFQQLCFLGGLLTIGFSPFGFALMFFIVHIPGVFFLSNKFAAFVAIGSLLGGLIFAYLQSLGNAGFLVALTIHLLFWIVFHFLLSGKTQFLGIVPIKR